MTETIDYGTLINYYDPDQTPLGKATLEQWCRCLAKTSADDARGMIDSPDGVPAWVDDGDLTVTLDPSTDRVVTLRYQGKERSKTVLHYDTTRTSRQDIRRELSLLSHDPYAQQLSAYLDRNPNARLEWYVVKSSHVATAYRDLDFALEAAAEDLIAKATKEVVK